MKTPVLALALAMSCAHAAHAACTDDVEAFGKTLDEKARDVGRTISGGQADAAARSAKAERSAKTGTKPADLPKPPTQANAAATTTAVHEGAGGAGVMSAKASLNAARVAAGKGDEQACQAALVKAKAQAAR